MDDLESEPKVTKQPEKPEVVVIATGGTIAGIRPKDRQTDYEAGRVGVDELIRAVPEVGEFANVTGVQMVSIGSQDMNDQIWLQLGREVERHLQRDQVSGVVITHGTDTMEETAYFLNLVVDSHKPVVLTGAMRPAQALSADGPLNLYNSVAVAASTQAAGHGVLVVANDFIHGAREVTKTNTLTVQTFESSSDRGLLGALHYGTFRMFGKPQRTHTADSIFSVKSMTSLPRVEVIYAYSNMQADIIEAVVDLGVEGIVLAGVGNGNASRAAIEALNRAARSGIAVVRSTRSNDGAVLRNQEINDNQMGFVVSDQLNPAKARVLLQLALTETRDPKTLQNFFWEY